MVSLSYKEEELQTDMMVDLETYCIREHVPFTIFEDWSSILASVKDIVAGKTTVKKVSAECVEDFKQGSNEKN